jgi:hypothetical protein
VRDVLLGHYYILSHGTRQVLAEEPEADAERLLAAKAVLAGSIAYSRVDDYELICSIENPDCVGAHDPARSDIDSRKTLQDEQIQMIQRRGEDTNQALARRGDGNWQVIADFQPFQPAMLGDC